MKPLKKAKKTKNLEVTSGKKIVKEKEIPINKKGAQDGVLPHSKVSKTVPEGFATVGLQIGATINMGDFQSARIDVFMQRNVPDTHDEILEGYEEISEILHEELARQSSLLADE